MSLLTNLPSSVLIGLAAFWGAWVGSFLNVVVHRLPRMIEAAERPPGEHPEEGQGAETYNLAWPGSHCPACKAPIRARHNIPLVGWLWLRGRCADCRAAIPVRYPLLELAGAIACGVAIAHFGVSFQGLAAAAVLCALLALAVIDLEHYLLPDAIVLPLLWLGLIANSFGLFVELEMAVWSAAGGYVAMRILGETWTRLRGVEALGRGDCKLIAAVGAWLGFHAVAGTLVVAGLVTAIFGIIRNRNYRNPVPFGPGIAVGMAIMLLIDFAEFHHSLLRNLLLL